MSRQDHDDLHAFAEGIGAALEEFNRNRNRHSTTKAPPPPSTASVISSLPSTRPPSERIDSASKDETNPKAKRTLRTAKKINEKPVYLVKLAVRKRKLGMDDIFEYESTKISRLEAQLDAQKAARDAGYPIFGHVHDIVRLSS